MANAERRAFVDQLDGYPGSITFAVDESGGLLWVRFEDGDYSTSAAEVMAGRGYHLDTDHRRTAAARGEFAEYFSGERTDFSIPLAVQGTTWQNGVWVAVRAIPYGETRSYGQIAASLGKPGAARAMGRANATNPVPIVVPCHRVVGTSGSLTGFAGGLHIKQRLLAHEASVLRSR